VHAAVAWGVLDQEHVVIRSADDEDYEARRKLFAAALAFVPDQPLRELFVVG